MSDPGALGPGVHGEGPDFRQVFPHDMKCAAADDPRVLVAFRDPELLDVLVKGDGRFVEQDASGDVPVEECAYGRDIARPGPSYGDGELIYRRVGMKFGIRIALRVL
ncbi:hypothetical protein SCALM49S_01919 [Streptomyces californicus]